MCLIFIALKQHPRYKMIVAANRDEFYQRKTAPAEYWSDHTEILGGRDLEAGGTWLAMNKNGKISMVTNFRDPRNINPMAPSRGNLVSDYLIGTTTPDSYLHELEQHASKFNGFNLLAGNPDKFFYLSNYSKGITRLDAGVYGLSNHLLETPWPKVERGKKKIIRALGNETVVPENLFSILYDDQVAPDDQLPDTGVGITRERALSSMFIKSPGYGTRCSTVILVDYQNNTSFTERVYNLETFEYKTQTFEFHIKGNSKPFEKK